MASSAELVSPAIAEKATPAVKRTTLMRTWLRDHLEKGRNKVYSERISVTPELARMLLECNKDNRKIRPAKLQQLKDDMNTHRFKFNGEPVIIAKTGELNDGQHRLQAIVETNRAQDMLIVFGVERDTRFTVDTGAARSASDHLTIGGWPYAAQISAVSRLVIAYERKQETGFGSMSDISSAAVLDRATDDKLLQECASFVTTNITKYRKICKTANLGFCFYQFAKRRPAEAKTFMEKLRTGADLSDASPIRMAREYLISRPKLSANARTEVILRAWNSWIKDKEVKLIKIHNEFPKIEG